jgi:hypothetical protein
MKAFFAALGGAAASLVCMSVVCTANDCPSAVKGRGVFIAERGEQSKTEVAFGDGAIVTSVSRLRGKPFLETRQYEGLIELERLDKGRKTSFKPKTDLAKIFPLKPKQQISVELDVSQDGTETSTMTVDLKMIGADNLVIGACNYDVLKFERIEAKSNRKSEPVIEYYAPELKFVVAKEYRERDRRTTLVKFDRVYSMEH